MPTDFSNYSDMNSCQVFKTIERKSGEGQKSRILNLEITWVEMSVLTHTVNASNWEAEQADLSQFQVSQGYTVRPCLKKNHLDGKMSGRNPVTANQPYITLRYVIEKIHEK